MVIGNGQWATGIWAMGNRQWASGIYYLEMSSLLKVSPGIRPRFFNQKIEAKEPEKKIP